MRKHFSRGLVILLPILLTMMIVSFLINFLTRPFLESAQAFIEHLNIFQHSIFLLHQETLISLSSRALVLILLIGLILLVGLFGKFIFINFFFGIGDYLLHRVPLINKIYKACQDIVSSLFSSSSKKFSQVVFVPFPHPNTLSMGLITGDRVKLSSSQQESQDVVSVFIPGTPNPSVGFMLMFKKEELLFLNMKVDEAMKFIVSCGVVMPNFEIIQTHDTYEKPFN